jgi:hypothetical protein
MFVKADPQTIIQVSRERYVRPRSEDGKKILLLGIIHGDRTYRIKRVSSDSPCVACYPRLGRKYIIHSGHSLGYLLAEAAPTDIALNTG